MKRKPSDRKIILITFNILLILFLCSCNIKNYKNEREFSTFSNSLGVNIHEGTTETDTKLIAQAGFKWVRIDIQWELVEKQKGVYDFKTSGYDHLTSLLEKNNLRPYYVLDYSNAIYENNKSITTNEGRKAFANFVKQVVKRYSGKGAIWEIWNEPNDSNFWVPQPSYEKYSLLVNEIAPIIKKEDKDSTVVAPALIGVSGESLKWLDETFKKGILANLDAVSVHPYRGEAPETVLADYLKINNLIKSYTSKNIPIISGEWGYHMENNDDKQNSELKQAQYAVRMMLINSLSKIPISVWYDFKNDGNDINNPGHNFGLMWPNNEPKMAYKAIENSTKILNGYHLDERIEIGQPDDYILKFSNEKNNKILVFWTTKNEHYITTTVASNTGEIISMLGIAQKVHWNNGQLTLLMSSSPQYLKFN